MAIGKLNYERGAGSGQGQAGPRHLNGRSGPGGQLFFSWGLRSAREFHPRSFVSVGGPGGPGDAAAMFFGRSAVRASGELFALGDRNERIGIGLLSRGAPGGGGRAENGGNPIPRRPPTGHSCSWFRRGSTR